MKSTPQLPPGLCGGVWWCLTCEAPADLDDPGEPQPRCVRCGHRKCAWHAQREGPLRLVSAPRLEAAPIEAEPMLNVRKLPRAERPTLSQMAQAGYWRCLACEQPTKKDEQDCCVLCGSSQVKFQEPTLTD